MMRKRIGSAGLGIRFLMKRTCWEVYHCMTGSIHPERGGVEVDDCMTGAYDCSESLFGQEDG
ncbi:hypothetical protein E3J49_02740 [Candidatus Bathyarchaeota archaeon]|nr:MAG: hypothetical protein E3J49_02740 [Candidatus Bathyarchaeota archaeon]